MDHDYLRAGTTETHMGPSPHIRSISSDALSLSPLSLSLLSLSPSLSLLSLSPSLSFSPLSLSLSSPQHAAAFTRQNQLNSAALMYGASVHPAAAYCSAISSGFLWWRVQSVCWKAISSFFSPWGYRPWIFYLLLPNTVHIPSLNYFASVMEK